MCEDIGLHYQSRLHFFRLASRVMRNLLVDHVRSRNAENMGVESILKALIKP